MNESKYENRDGISEVEKRVNNKTINLDGLKKNNDGNPGLEFYSDIHGVVLYITSEGNFSLDRKGRIWVYDEEWNKNLVNEEAQLLDFLKERHFEIEVFNGQAYAISPMVF